MRRDWDRGCGRSSRARAGLRRSRGSRRTGRAAGGRRAVQSPTSSMWTRNTAPRCSIEAFTVTGFEAEIERQLAEAEIWDRRVQPEAPSERSRLAGRAAPREPSRGCSSRWRSRNRNPQRRVNASTSAWIQNALAGGSFELPAILQEVRVTAKIFPGEAGRVERPQILVRARRPPIGAAHGRHLHWQVADRSACRDDTRRGSGITPSPRQRMLPRRQGTGSRLVRRAPA